MCIYSTKHLQKLKTDNKQTTGAWVNIGVPVALGLVLLATLVPFFLAGSIWAQTCYPYVYTAGAIILLIIRLFTPYRGSDLKLKRWHRIEAWCPIFFLVAAFFLFYPQGQMRDWLAFTLAGAFIQIITSIAIPSREARLAKEDKSHK